MEENKETRVGYKTLSVLRDIYVDMLCEARRYGLDFDYDLAIKVDGLNRILEE